MPKNLTNEEFKQRLKDYTNDTVELITPYVNRRTKVTIKCKTCGYEWQISPSSLAPSEMKKYSFNGCPECKYEIIKCDYCGKEFKRLKSLVKDTFNYCSRECGNKHKNQLRLEAGKWNNSKTSYRIRALKKHPHKCIVCGWDEDDRILEVHHIDENRENNSIDNLCILCPTCHRKITLGFYELTKDFKLLKK